MGKPLRWILILIQPVSSVFAYSYDPWYRGETKRPVDVITDVVNDLGVKILQQYSSHGNVAFSPTGVAFVLAALYEGSAGRGSQQILDAVGLPANRDVTRIGFRDIHRRLRSYLNADGFLGGLTLSRENTRLRPEYEDILRFYGFDLSSIEQEANVTVSVEDTPATSELPTSTVDLTSTTSTAADATTLTTTGAVATTLPSSETTVAPSATQQTVTTPMTANVPTATSASQNTAAAPLTTVAPVNTGQTSAMDNQATSSSTMVTVAGNQSPQMPTAAGVVTTNEAPAESNAGDASTSVMPTIPPSVQADTTVVPETEAAPTPGTEETPVVVTNAATAETEAAASTIATTTPADTATSSPQVPLAPITPDTTVIPTMDIVPNTEPSATTTPSVTSAGDTSETTTAVDLTTASITDVSNAAGAETTTVISSVPNGTSPDDLAGNSNNSTTAASADNQAIGRKRKSIEREATELESKVRDGTYGGTVKDESTGDRPAHLRKRPARSPRGYFSSYPDEGIWMQDLDIWKSYSTMSPRESSGDATSEIEFLVNGCDVYSVSGSRYIAVLPFAYFPSLHAVALEFPLDDPRYNIILLMPTDRTDTHRLARNLSGKSLRALRKRLQPTWVRATIPSFMLRGFVTLTSFLQRLGILDVFEPRVADLSPMTADLGVYARDVQQSIGVNIRNYMKPDRTHSRNGLFERAGPVPFTAMHPFLYFIVDTETSVSLIAGRVDDPLNSRIL